MGNDKKPPKDYRSSATVQMDQHKQSMVARRANTNSALQRIAKRDAEKAAAEAAQAKEQQSSPQPDVVITSHDMPRPPRQVVDVDGPIGESMLLKDQPRQGPMIIPTRTPIKDMPLALRHKAIFKLTNYKDKVIMVINFVEGTTQAEAKLFHQALESKAWDSPNLKPGFESQYVTDDRGKAHIAITGTRNLVLLLKELTDNKVPMTTSPDFKTTPRFEEMLAAYELRWRNPRGGQMAKG